MGTAAVGPNYCIAEVWTSRWWHVAIRAEYRGFVYNRPDFELAALNSQTTTHTAQPSAGVVFRF
jgi:hypothetical protein